MKKMLASTLTALLLISGAALADAKSDFQKAMKAAREARHMAQSVDGEWRDIGKILKHAKKAASKGNYEKAIGLARFAEFQGKMGYSQAMSQKGIGNPDYFYN